jgi:hypothetical protein
VSIFKGFGLEPTKPDIEQNLIHLLTFWSLEAFIFIPKNQSNPF